MSVCMDMQQGGATVGGRSWQTLGHPASLVDGLMGSVFTGGQNLKVTTLMDFLRFFGGASC